jgi:hypothetical protein
MGHTYGTITDTMDFIRTEKKGKHLTTQKNTTYTKSVKESTYEQYVY